MPRIEKELVKEKSRETRSTDSRVTLYSDDDSIGRD